MKGVLSLLRRGDEGQALADAMPYRPAVYLAAREVKVLECLRALGEASALEVARAYFRLSNVTDRNKRYMNEILRRLVQQEYALVVRFERRSKIGAPTNIFRAVHAEDRITGVDTERPDWFSILRDYYGD